MLAAVPTMRKCALRARHMMLPGPPEEGTWKVPSLSSFPESCMGCTVTLPACMLYDEKVTSKDVIGKATADTTEVDHENRCVCKYGNCFHKKMSRMHISRPLGWGKS